MPRKFRKKPVVIEAFQMTEERRASNVDWPNWLHEAWNKSGEGSLFIDADDPERLRLCIGTLEGVHRVSWGDWIIKGVKGELYPCKPDVFAATYEEAGNVMFPTREEYAEMVERERLIAAVVKSSPPFLDEEADTLNAAYALAEFERTRLSKQKG